MLTVLFENVRTGESLSLNEISTNGSGVQAVAGATGFGLPPVTVHWFEGAGDGAQYRGYKAEPRDLDIPLFVEAANRANLKAKLATLSRVVTGAFLIKLVEDDDVYRTIEVARVGGGTYTYGQDTTGETDWESVLTVRAGSPFWQFATGAGAGPWETGTDTIIVNNPGTADAYPIWTCFGPISSVTVTNDDTGESFAWSGQVNYGEMLTIDTETATCTDQAGSNRYDGLATAPSLFRLAPGDNSVTVTVTKPASLVRTNYVTNPTFGNTTHGWTPSGDGVALGRVSVVSGRLRIGNSTSDTEATSAERSISGLTPGVTYQVRVKFGGDGVPRALQVLHTLRVTNIDAGTQTVFTAASDVYGEVVTTVVAGGSGFITISASAAYTGANYCPTYVDQVYVGLPGEYFDGDTTDTASVTYAWVGTANSSRSTATAVDHDPEVAVDFLPRDWMVV